LKISTARELISPKLPIGVPIIYSVATNKSIIGMDSNLKLLLYIIIGLLLMWIGYKLFFMFFKEKDIKNDDRDTESANGAKSGSNGEPVSGAKPPMKKYKGTEDSGGLMICPLCLFKMESSEMIKTTAFPPATPDSKDRLMHIHGCVYCMDGKRERICPVCGKPLGVKDFLVARIFDRSVRRSHVHVLGCTICRPLKTM
jgi:hypothetical protein